MAWTSAPARRLNSYWKLEAANAVLVPAFGVLVVHRYAGTITGALVLSALACSFLLVIGAIALRMMLGKARGEVNATTSRIPVLIRMQWPAIGLCAAAAVSVGHDWMSHGFHPSADRIASTVLLLLAWLEYVNYYHVQLRHFDHAADWRRLRTGRGFRRSHLACEIARWKRHRKLRAE